MKSFASTIIASALFPITAFADKRMSEAGEMTNIAEAEWVGVAVAIFIITTAIIVARIIRK